MMVIYTIGIVCYMLVRQWWAASMVVWVKEALSDLLCHLRKLVTVYLCINSHFPGEPGLDGATWFSPSPYTLFHKRTLGDKCHRFFWPGTQPTVSKQWRKQSADTNQCSGVILFYLPPDCWWNVIAFFRQLSDAITNIWGAEVLKLTVEKTSWFYAQIVITTDH